jgi:hypothetical protein
VEKKTAKQVCWMVDEGKLEETEDDKEKEIWKNHQILPSGPISIDV